MNIAAARVRGAEIFIRKIQPEIDLRPKQRKKGKETYDGQVTAARAQVWEIFDYPCGQRLKPVLEVEVDSSKHQQPL